MLLDASPYSFQTAKVDLEGHYKLAYVLAFANLYLLTNFKIIKPLGTAVSISNMHQTKIYICIEIIFLFTLLTV